MTPSAMIQPTDRTPVSPYSLIPWFPRPLPPRISIQSPRALALALDLETPGEIGSLPICRVTCFVLLYNKFGDIYLIRQDQDDMWILL